jgi:hypothetical protein
VAGRVYDLNKLDKAQRRINDLCDSFGRKAVFNAAAADPAALEADIAALAASVAESRAKVSVLDAGKQGAGAERYGFKKSVATATVVTSVV